MEKGSFGHDDLIWLNVSFGHKSVFLFLKNNFKILILIIWFLFLIFHCAHTLLKISIKWHFNIFNDNLLILLISYFFKFFLFSKRANLVKATVLKTWEKNSFFFICSWIFWIFFSKVEDQFFGKIQKMLYLINIKVTCFTIWFLNSSSPYLFSSPKFTILRSIMRQLNFLSLLF